MKRQDSIAISEVTEGSVLAMAVHDEAGRLLVPAGVALSISLLQSLQRRQISRLIIEREVVDDPVAAAARLQQVEQQLDQLFRRAGDGLETAALRQAITAFRLERDA